MANPNPSPRTRFRPGNPGGPGRPRLSAITVELRRQLGDEATAEALARLWLARVLAGDFRYLKALLDRVEGKAPAAVYYEDDDEGPGIRVPPRDQPRPEVSGCGRPPAVAQQPRNPERERA
jgi:hypothetical protein